MIKGIGCDILKIDKVKHLLKTTPAFLTKCFSKRELEEYHKRNDIAYLASRFAAKEAIFKTLSQYNHDFNTIEILNDNNGKPYVVIQNELKPQILVSISYEEDYVIACAALSSIL